MTFLGILESIRQAFLSLEAIIVVALRIIKIKINISPEKRKQIIRYGSPILLFLIICTSIYAWLTKKPEICLDAANTKLYQDGLSNNHYQYFTKRGEVLNLKKQSVNFDNLRQQQLKLLLHLADSALLVRKNKFSYEQKIGSYFGEYDELSIKIVNELRKNRYLFINEKLDTNNCSYLAAISLAKAKAIEIDSLIALARESACLRNAIDGLIMKPLNRNGEVSLSFYSIFSKLCSTCPKDPQVVYWLKGRINQTRDLDSLYFEKSKYELSDYSRVVLKYVAASLSKSKNQKYILALHGFTDPSPVSHNIPYDEAGHYADQPGVLLPGGMPLKSIDTNLQLSYARAYSCYNYLNDLLDLKKVKLFYTGDGVSKNMDVPDPHQRAVNIYIRKEN